MKDLTRLMVLSILAGTPATLLAQTGATSQTQFNHIPHIYLTGITGDNTLFEGEGLFPLLINQRQNLYVDLSGTYEERSNGEVLVEGMLDCAAVG